jgi:hypothetical protein
MQCTRPAVPRSLDCHSASASCIRHTGIAGAWCRLALMWFLFRLAEVLRVTLQVRYTSASTALVELLDDLAMSSEAAALEKQLDLPAGIAPATMVSAWRKLAMQELGTALQPSQSAPHGRPLTGRLSMLPAGRPSAGITRTTSSSAAGLARTASSTGRARVPRPSTGARPAAPGVGTAAGQAAVTEDFLVLRQLVQAAGVEPESSAANGQPLTSCSTASLEGQVLLRPHALYQAWARTARFLLRRGCHDAASKLLTPALECATITLDDSARAECTLLLARAQLQSGAVEMAIQSLQAAQAGGHLSAQQLLDSVMLYVEARLQTRSGEADSMEAVKAGLQMLGTLGR